MAPEAAATAIVRNAVRRVMEQDWLLAVVMGAFLSTKSVILAKDTQERRGDGHLGFRLIVVNKQAKHPRADAVFPPVRRKSWQLVSLDRNSPSGETAG